MGFPSKGGERRNFIQRSMQFNRTNFFEGREQCAKNSTKLMKSHEWVQNICTLNQAVHKGHMGSLSPRELNKSDSPGSYRKNLNSIHVDVPDHKVDQKKFTLNLV